MRKNGSARVGNAPGGERAPTILYVDCRLGHGIEGKRLEGLRRYAATRKWRVATLEHKFCSSAALRNALARLRPVGCAAECWSQETTPSPALFGKIPVVYFSRREGKGWENVRSVEADDAAVARMAFAELSASNPPAYAVATHNMRERWARERIDTFRNCCREAGFDCRVRYFPRDNDAQRAVCQPNMKAWVASLPHRCAIFASNDYCALRTAYALADAGRPFPSTVTLMGADGVETCPYGHEIAETVTSVRLDFELAGYLAGKELGAMISGTKAANPKAVVFPPLLVDWRKSTRGSGRREPWVLEAVDSIRREACDGLEPAGLPARFGVSRRNFDRRFREAMGHTAQEEIEHVRMERVFELLRDGSMPIGAIASFSGWRSDIALRWLFRRRTGMSMRDWRRMLS